MLKSDFLFCITSNTLGTVVSHRLTGGSSRQNQPNHGILINMRKSQAKEKRANQKKKGLATHKAAEKVAPLHWLPVLAPGPQPGSLATSAGPNNDQPPPSFLPLFLLFFFSLPSHHYYFDFVFLFVSCAASFVLLALMAVCSSCASACPCLYATSSEPRIFFSFFFFLLTVSIPPHSLLSASSATFAIISLTTQTPPPSSLRFRTHFVPHYCQCQSLPCSHEPCLFAAAMSCTIPQVSSRETRDEQGFSSGPVGS